MDTTDSKVTTANINSLSSPSYAVQLTNSESFDGNILTTAFHPFSEVSYVDDEGHIKIGHNNIHIQPLNSGFLLIIGTREEGLKYFAFEDYKKLLTFLGDNIILDKDTELVADNV